MSTLRERLEMAIHDEQVQQRLWPEFWDLHQARIDLLKDCAAALERQGAAHPTVIYCGQCGALYPCDTHSSVVKTMSHYNGWGDVPLTPEETWEQRAEAFRRGMTEVDQAGDMLAELRYQIADLLAERGVAQLVIAELTRERDEARAVLNSAMDEFLRVSRERDEARAKLDRLAKSVEDRGVMLTAADLTIRRLTQERDEARAALMKRITRDAA